MSSFIFIMLLLFVCVAVFAITDLNPFCSLLSLDAYRIWSLVFHCDRITLYFINFVINFLGLDPVGIDSVVPVLYYLSICLFTCFIGGCFFFCSFGLNDPLDNLLVEWMLSFHSATNLSYLFFL